MGQVVQIPLQLLDRFADPGGAHDQTHVVGVFELAEGFAQVAAVLALDAPRHATGARVVRHQHQVAAGQRDEGGQRRALVAALLFLDLDDDLEALGDGLVDADAAGLPAGLFGEVVARDLLHREEAVALRAVIDEGGFQAGFDAGDAAFVDVGFLLFAGGGFDIEIEQLLAIDDGDAQLFGLSRVDQHSFHCRMSGSMHA